MGFGQTICLSAGRKCGDCELGLQGLCKAADRGKVIMGRKKKEETVLKDENDTIVEKVEASQHKVKVEDGVFDNGSEKVVKPQIHKDGS